MSGQHHFFGETAVERGFITREQLAQALAVQGERRDPPRIGDILIELGMITPSQAEAIAKYKEVLDSGLTADEGSRYGEALIGQTLGGCLLLEIIGRGGMGTTYRGHHLRLDRDVAVKVLHPRLTRIPGMAERFQREAQAAAKLSHPNVVSVFDFDREGPFTFMIMQHVPGRNLKEVLESGGQMSPRQALWVIARVLKGLEAAHELGLVHRDIKPANIILTEAPTQVFITDFGTVRLLNTSSRENMTVYGELLGTPQYMAPEQATAGDIDPRTDLYGVGLTLFELVEGRPAFSGASTVEVLEKQILEPVPALSEPNPGIDDFIARLSAKDPDERFPSAAFAGQALQQIYPATMGRATGRLGTVRFDPSRAAGARAPEVDMAAVGQVAQSLRQGDDQRPGAFLETRVLLDSALSVDLRPIVAELIAAGRGERVVPELLLYLWKNGAYQKILDLSRDLEKALPALASVPFFEGLCYNRLGEAEKARDRFAVSAALDATHLPAHLHLASAQTELGQVEEAAETLRRAALLHPESIKAAVRYAEHLSHEVEDLEAALAAYERVLELAPERLDIRQKIGLILCDLGRVDEADTVAEELREWAQGDARLAAPLLEQILRLRRARASASDPELPVIRERLPFDESSDEAEKATASRRVKRPTAPRPPAIPAELRQRLELLRLAVAGGKWGWAREIYAEAKASHLEVPELHLAFGQACLALGRPIEARAAFEETLRLRPESKKAVEGLERAAAMPR